MSLLQQQTRILLRGDMGGFVLSLLVLFVGLAALTVHLLRLKSKDRTLLWFGLFAGLYGLRALCRHSISRALFDVPASTWRYADSIISDVIVTPALLFFAAVYGRGWKSGLIVLIWAQAVWGAVAILVDVLTQSPGRAPDPSNLLLFITPPLLLIAYLKGYRPPRSLWTAIIFAGGAAFLLSVMIDHLSDAGFTPWRFRAEPFGFMVNLACLGYVAVQRFVTNEQELVAIGEEMKSAARIQASILPRTVPDVPGLRIAVRYLPMTAVAGDFYDFLPGPGGSIGILVADVTGHSVPAALIASMVKVAVSSQAENAGDPGKVIGALNQVLCRQVQGQLTTAGYLFVDAANGTARYAAAGHPPLLLWRKGDRALDTFKDNGLVMGIRQAEKYSNTEIALRPGDRFVLYSDGIPEASNRDEEFFGDQRLADFIAANDQMAAGAFADALLASIAGWSGVSAQGDDITLAVIDVIA